MISILLFFSYITIAQTRFIPNWQDYFPYRPCLSVIEKGNQIWSATPYSLYYYDKNDGSLNQLNKTTIPALNDIGISCFAHSETYNTFIVAYSNANIDLIKEGKVINVPDVRLKQMPGNKTINSIFIKDKYAYLACGFGIIVVDLIKNEIKDSYFIGANGAQVDVKDITFHETDNRFYVATSIGIYSASATSTLSYFDNWSAENGLPVSNVQYNFIVSFGGKLFANSTQNLPNTDALFVKTGNSWSAFEAQNTSTRTGMGVSRGNLFICSAQGVDMYTAAGTHTQQWNTYSPGNISPLHAIIDNENTVWIADKEQGLMRIDKNGASAKYAISGPWSSDIFDMDISAQLLWTVAGAHDAAFANAYKQVQFSSYTTEGWKNYLPAHSPYLAPMRDAVCVAADKQNPTHAFIGTWGYGIVEMKDGTMQNIYNATNSTLQPATGFGDGFIRVGGMSFDTEQNLWLSNSGAKDILSVRTAAGKWISYNLGAENSSIDVSNIIIDGQGKKWLQLRDNAVIIFDDNHTPENKNDDKYCKLTSAYNNGGWSGSGVYSMACGRDGQIWLGTDNGIFAFYNPEKIGEGSAINAKEVMLENNGYLYPLLGTEKITCICVNGNNEKWIGTEKSGVFLVSENGTKEMYHFNKENSPLPDNHIISIKIAANGKVFLATAAGLVSFNDHKTEPLAQLETLNIFPNPVRPNYTGNVFIKNLMDNSYVKITDASGALVWETQSQGGSVAWNRLTLDGQKVTIGVYFIFAISPDGKSHKNGKVLFVAD